MGDKAPGGYSRPLPIFDPDKQTSIRELLTAHSFHPECYGQVIFHMRQAYLELESAAPHQEARWRPKRWLDRLRSTAKSVCGGSATPDELLALLAEVSSLSNRQLLQLFPAPVYRCLIHFEVLSRERRSCPICEAIWLAQHPEAASAVGRGRRNLPSFPLELSRELDSKFINELVRVRNAIAEYPKSPDHWRALVGDMITLVQGELLRTTRAGPPNQPLVRMLVWRLAAVYLNHVINPVLFSKNPLTGEYEGEGIDFITRALEAYGFIEGGHFGFQVKRITVGQYLERMPHRVNRAHRPIT